MIPRLIVLAAASFALSAAAAGMPSRNAPFAPPALDAAFRAPGLHVFDAVALPAPLQKSAPEKPASGPRRVGSVRELDAPARIGGWSRVPGGFVAKFRATSADALGLRVRLDLGVMPGTMEIRAQGSDARIQTMVLDPRLGPDAWTPWTDGETQLVELFTRVLPGSDDAIRIGAVLHFDAPMQEKVAASCTLETACAATDATLAPGVPEAIQQREKSEFKMQFVDNGQGFVCSGTLINTEKYPAPYVLTANHCIATDAAARTITTRWFYVSNQACIDQDITPFQQVSGGTQLVFTNYNVDSTLLLMNSMPPAGATYSGWNPARLSANDPVVSISHPTGDTARYAVGTISQLYRLEDWPQEMYGVRFSRGIIQGGSSGSGLFTMANGSLELRGILTGSTVNSSSEGLSCTDLNEDGLYSRFEIFEPELVPYITTAGLAPDDAPNRPQDLFGAPIDPSGPDVLDKRATPFALDNRHIDYAGDLDVYRVVLTAPSWVSLWTQGANLDTVGTLLDSTGSMIEVNDDAETGNNHFGITRELQAGTYYLQVAHWEPAGTGAYDLRMRADALGTNYTDLWWNPAESGWGINIDHQDHTIFATLFTYDETGAPMWLVMSSGTAQADGSYSGALYRTTGSAFNAAPFGPATPTQVGTMRLAFSGPGTATLTYTYNGTQVTKSITRQAFSTPNSCAWSAFDRSFSTNFQDLWWNPAEPGWGVNIAHQGDILFATLFTYDASGKGMWLVMPSGAVNGAGSYSGTLYRTHGPAFNASPWSVPSNQAVGTMSFTFTDGNAGTMTYSVDGVQVTKQIQRQVFGALKTQCGP